MMIARYDLSEVEVSTRCPHLIRHPIPTTAPNPLLHTWYYMYQKDYVRTMETRAP